jgi:hypothetical protein
MKDQNTIVENETKEEKWERAVDLFVESVLKPDDKLRQCAHNQKCYDELMTVRKNVLNYLTDIR